MDRVRLDMGALSVSDFQGGNFVFFLYKKGGDKCLPIKLSRQDVNIILSNFKNKELNPSEELPTMQMLYCTTLQHFGIELLEITVIKGIGSNRHFMTELLLFDGKKELRLVCGFGDGIVMAKFFNAPIYVYSDVLEKFATKVNTEGKKVYRDTNYKTKLTEALKDAISGEDYERAEQLKNELHKLSLAAEKKPKVPEKPAAPEKKKAAGKQKKK